jgi:hypothetical protein
MLYHNEKYEHKHYTSPTLVSIQKNLLHIAYSKGLPVHESQEPVFAVDSLGISYFQLEKNVEVSHDVVACEEIRTIL